MNGWMDGWNINQVPIVFYEKQREKSGVVEVFEDPEEYRSNVPAGVSGTGMCN